MSLIPYIFTHELLDVPSQHYHFGHGFNPNTVWPVDLPVIRPNRAGYVRPWVSLMNLANHDGTEKVSHIDKDGTFQVSLDCQHFAPNEINVKTVDNSIIVEAKHEEHPDDHGYISRQFTRRYNLPEGFNVKDVTSAISSDGVLTIKVPPFKPAIDGSNVRHVPLQQTGPAHLTIKQGENKK